MQNEAGSLYTLAGVAVTALATIVVAAISAWRGRKAGEEDGGAAAPAGESGDHVHTRDVLKAGLRGIHDKLDDISRRMDALLFARGFQREQEQLARSAERIAQRMREEDSQ